MFSFFKDKRVDALQARVDELLTLIENLTENVGDKLDEIVVARVDAAIEDADIEEKVRSAIADEDFSDIAREAIEDAFRHASVSVDF